MLSDFFMVFWITAQYFIFITFVAIYISYQFFFYFRSHSQRQNDNNDTLPFLSLVEMEMWNRKEIWNFPENILYSFRFLYPRNYDRKPSHRDYIMCFRYLYNNIWKFKSGWKQISNISVLRSWVPSIRTKQLL